MNMPKASARSSHWEKVYLQKSAFAVSWYRDHLETSLHLLAEANVGPLSHVLDVGGGASTLVDDLLDRGVGNVTVMDLSTASLLIAQTRLGTRALQVSWRVGDITKIALPAAGFSHWHDRAVLHFLTDPADVRAYAMQAVQAVAPGGHAMIGGFAPDGPEQCSGLPVVRRSAEDIAAVLGTEFALIATATERHITPGGDEQSFTYALLRRR